MPRRRTVLALVGSLATAGCVAPSSSRESARLGSVQLVNDDTEPAAVTVEVVHQGVPVFEETYDAPAETKTSLPITADERVPDDGRDVTIRASLKGDDRWQTATLENRYDQSCLDAFIRISANGMLLVRLSGCE